MISQCPNCNTRFLVTEAQIAQSNGMVRCGACMKPFKVHQDVTTAVSSDRQSPLSPGSRNNAGNLEPSAGNNEPSAENNEPSALNKEPSAVSKKPLAANNKEPSAMDNEPSVSEKKLSAPDKSAPSNGESDSKNTPPRPAGLTALARLNQSLRKPSTGSVGNAAPFSVSRRLRGDGRIEPVVSSQGAVSIDALSSQLNPEPVTFSASSTSASSLIVGAVKWLFGLTLCIVLLATLAIQLKLLQPSQLPTIPAVQNAYAQLCELIHCEPSSIDQSAYVSRKLLVYSHPENPDALMIESVIVNLATTALPFPLIHFEFANLHGDIVASRVFAPSEYLNGELLGKQAFEPASPVRIALEIRDPGKEAVNYQMVLLPAAR